MPNQRFYYDWYDEIEAFPLKEKEYRNLANEILQTLHSLGYVKMVEQKLPKDNDGYQRKFLYDIKKLLSVDAEGCAYRRVKVK